MPEMFCYDSNVIPNRGLLTECEESHAVSLRFFTLLTLRSE